MRKIFLIGCATYVFLLSQDAHAATLTLSPSSNSVGVGSTVSVNVTVSSTDQAMNAVSSQLTFTKDTLQLLSVSKSGSIVTIWASEPSFSNADGTASFEGIVPNPGYAGTSGRIVTLTFRAKAVGTGQVSFSSASVLANDGLATNILTSSPSRSISIVEGVKQELSPEPTPTGHALTITSPTHPNQGAWYNKTDVTFEWQNSPTVEAVKLGYGPSSQNVPQVNYDPPIARRTLTLEEGVTYFSAQERTGDGWGTIARYKVQIDTEAPSPFTVSVVESSGKPPAAQFRSEDVLSGIDRYEILINDAKIGSISEGELAGGVYDLPEQGAGTVRVKVIAYDKAGNAAVATTSYVSKESPVSPSNPKPLSDFAKWLYGAWWTVANYIVVVFGIASVIAAIMFVFWYVWHHFHRTRRGLLKRIAATDRELHNELRELHRLIRAEVQRLKDVGARRELTQEEEHIMTLLENTQKIMGREFPRSSK